MGFEVSKSGSEIDLLGDPVPPRPGLVRCRDCKAWVIARKMKSGKVMLFESVVGMEKIPHACSTRGRSLPKIPPPDNEEFEWEHDTKNDK